MMCLNPFGWRGVLLVAACVMLATQYSFGDDVAEAGQRALAEKDFPWFDSDSNSTIGIRPEDPGRAKSINRAAIPEYTPEPTSPPQAGSAGGNGTVLTILSVVVWIAISVVFLSIVAALVWFFLKMEGRSGGSNSSRDEDRNSVRARIKQLPFSVPDDAVGNFRERAARAAASGDYGLATMMLFSHVLLHLDETGRIRLKKGKTNRQYLRELGSDSQVLQYYQRVMIPFEKALFGDHAIHQTEFEACWQDLDQFQERVRSSLQAVPQ